MSTGKGKAWRSAFQSLKEVSLNSSSSRQCRSSAIQAILSDSRTLLSSAACLPPSEVTQDIMCLISYISREELHSADNNSCSIVRGICHLIRELSYHSQLDLKPPCLVQLIEFLIGIIERLCSDLEQIPSGHDAVDLCNKSRLAMEALQALNNTIHEHGANLAVQDVTNTVEFFLHFVYGKRNRPLPSSSKNVLPSKDLNKRMHVDIELHSLAFSTIGSMLAQAGSVLSKDTWKLIMEAMRETMDFLALKSNLEENNIMSRYYSAFLRCLQLVLSDPKDSLTEHVSGFAIGLQNFFSYGLTGNVSGGTACSPAISSSGKTLDPTSTSQTNVPRPYRPPHLRRIRSSANQMFFPEENNGPVQNKASLSSFSSDSDLSDSDGALKEGDRFKSSKTRMAAILCIQALCRAEPKALHAQWTVLLPTQDVLHRRHHLPTLMTCLLFDPIQKARMAAAATLVTMLEGPSATFLQIAEFKETAKSGSFTALSCLIGQMLMQLHAGLLSVVQTESHSGLLMATFKALSLLASAAPYNRLPPDLLPTVVSSIGKKVDGLYQDSHEHCSIVAAAVSCVGTILSISPPLHQIASILEEGLPPGIDGKQPLPSMLFQFIRPEAHPVIRYEALQALKAAVHSYSFVMSRYWKQISSAVLEVIELSLESRLDAPLVSKGNLSLNLKAIDDKTVLSAIKVLDEFLRGVSGFQGADDSLDDAPSHAFQSLLPRSTKTFISPARSSSESSKLNQNSAAGVISGHYEWAEALESHIPISLGHFASMVRAAALTCFAGSTSSVFFSLPEKKQDFIISSIVTAASKDEVPSVRSAACRAIGVIAGFQQIFASVLEKFVNVILLECHDTSLSVRITASWALANICDSLRHKSSSNSKMDFMVDKFIVVSLMECALQLSKDGDKIKANAVRALGNLSRFVNFGESMSVTSFSDSCKRLTPKSMPKQKDMKQTNVMENSPCLEKMVHTFVSCVTTGNVKVQWNVCHALGNLFLNESIRLQNMTWTSSVYSILLLLLRDSLNFKIRIHAAAALAVPSTREDYCDSFVDILQALIHILESLDSDQVAVPSSFKYRQALSEQLKITTLHVLGCASLNDCKSLHEFVFKRISFLEEWLRSACATVDYMVHNCEEFGQNSCMDSNDCSMVVRKTAEIDPSLSFASSLDSEQILIENRISEYCSKAESSSLIEGAFAKKLSILRAIRTIVIIFRQGNHQHLILHFENIVRRYFMI